MKPQSFVAAVLLLLGGCATTQKNPYYHLNILYPPHQGLVAYHIPTHSELTLVPIYIPDTTLYRMEGLLSVVTELPDSLGGTSVEGEAVYELVMDDKKQVRKAQLMGVQMRDSTTKRQTVFDIYDIRSRYVRKVPPELARLDNYLSSRARGLQFIELVKPAKRNKVYLQFVFNRFPFN